MRLIVRKERPHPGAQLRITDADGMRLTCFATNTTGRPIAELELRHRQPGPGRGPHPRRPRHRPAQPAPARHRPEPDLAGDRPDRARPAGLDAHARPDRPGPALGTRVACGSACSPPPPSSSPPAAAAILRLARHWPWTDEITAALERLAAPARTPADQQLHRPCDSTTRPGSGTRRPPDATAGPPACPASAPESKRVHRLRRRTLKKDRG